MLVLVLVLVLLLLLALVVVFFLPSLVVVVGYGVGLDAVGLYEKNKQSFLFGRRPREPLNSPRRSAAVVHESLVANPWIQQRHYVSVLQVLCSRHTPASSFLAPHAPLLILAILCLAVYHCRVPRKG